MSIDHEIGQPPRLLPRTIEDVLQQWALRGAGLALIATTIVVWGAMLTWSPGDPSLSLNTSEPASNIFGAPGAVIADFFIHTLGLSVVFFCVPPMVLGLELALGDRITDHRRRLALFAVATVAIAAGCSALPLVDGWPLALGYGGILGDFAYSAAAGILGEIVPGVGGAVVGVAFIALGFWAFSRAAGLDRYNIFAVALPRFGEDAATDIAARGIGRVAAWRRGGKLLSPRADVHAPTPHETTRDHALEPNLSHPATVDWNEPEPPAWLPHEPLNKYGQPASHGLTERDAAPGHPIASAVAGDANSAHMAQPVILLKDENGGTESPSDDLPNVLIRARREAADLMLGPASRAAPGHRAEPPLLLDFPGNAPAQHRPSSIDPQPSADPRVVATGYRRPSLNLLRSTSAPRPSADTSPSVLKGRARILEDVLADFRIKGEIRDVRPGPVITQFELEPARGTKSSRVIALADDVARSMSSVSARIAVVPGRNAIGIELPNTRRETFGLRELIDSEAFVDSSAKLPIVLGKGIAGEPVLADLARMPHLLVAGTTGSGKSVGINAMIMSLIYRLSPKNCRFLMIDPKMLELSAYNGIPHLLTPVVTDPQQAVTALTWAVGEMEERYKRMAELGVRGIDAFNNRVKHASRTGEKLSRQVQTGFDPATGDAVYEETRIDAEEMPYIVIVVDEFADLMAVAGKEIEGLVQRLAQMARAAGIHMIMATQRPSVDVVTGTIKANFPTRISYRVASRIDSRTILNEQGGEQLLGQGDMLFLSEAGNIQRVHGPFVSDEEVEAVASSLRGAYRTDYVHDIIHAGEPGNDHAMAAKPGDLYDQAVEVVLSEQKASTSYLQRRLSIGYNRAADLIERMETDGVIGPADHSGRRVIFLAS